MRIFLLAIVLIIISSGLVFAEEGNDPSKPYFSMDLDKKRELLKNAKTIKVGDSYETVPTKLGKPTYDHFVGLKETHEITGRRISYYAVVWKENLVNEKHDQLISISFDKADRVKSIHIKMKPD